MKRFEVCYKVRGKIRKVAAFGKDIDSALTSFIVSVCIIAKVITQDDIISIVAK